MSPDPSVGNPYLEFIPRITHTQTSLDRLAEPGDIHDPAERDLLHVPTNAAGGQKQGVENETWIEADTQNSDTPSTRSSIDLVAQVRVCRPRESSLFGGGDHVQAASDTGPDVDCHFTQKGGGGDEQQVCFLVQSLLSLVADCHADRSDTGVCSQIFTGVMGIAG